MTVTSQHEIAVRQLRGTRTVIALKRRVHAARKDQRVTEVVAVDELQALVEDFDALVTIANEYHQHLAATDRATALARTGRP